MVHIEQITQHVKFVANNAVLGNIFDVILP
jgi:hypothetical protein